MSTYLRLTWRRQQSNRYHRYDPAKDWNCSS